MPTYPNLAEELKKHFGFDTFKGHQEAIIRNLLEERNTLVLMPTGGGKSMCFQLPSLLMEGTAIVVSPLIALMKNQVDAMRNFSEEDGIAHFLNSSLTKPAVEAVKQDVASGKTKLLYVAPETLIKEENVEFLRSVKISFYAIDEAQCISEWGHDFRPEYRRIRPLINQIGDRPVIALTATATPKVQSDILKNLAITDASVFTSSFDRPNLYYEVRPKTKDVDREIIRFIKANPGKSGIIYCLSRKKVEELSELLRVNDISSLPYHAGMESNVRSENQDAFIHERIDVIVATIAFGMGIDKPNVRFVVHYDVPKSIESYYQETGRAGRDGGEGKCITFYAKKDLKKLEKFMQAKQHLSEQEIGRQLLAETATFAESSVCRRKMLLHYFGEPYDRDNCGNCDNCLHPRREVVATDEMCYILETISELKERFKADHIVNVLTGYVSSEVNLYKHDQIELFGILGDVEAKFLYTLINQGTIAGLISKDIENYGVLHLTAAGRRFLDKPTPFIAVLDHEFNESDEYDASPTMATGALDPTLFSILSDLRRQIARELDLPPYVVFQDPALEAMATTYPITLDEMRLIPGVGDGKTRRFGERFLDVIKQYVEDYDIERPEDFKFRTNTHKSNIRQSLLPGIDRQVDFDALAQGNDLTVEQLITELETIVNNGHKINIDYHINEVLDPDSVQEIFDFFRNNESGDLQAAIDHFTADGDFTEEEVRLVHIKFLSDMGN